jgi:hypothetical protein
MPDLDVFMFGRGGVLKQTPTKVQVIKADFAHLGYLGKLYVLLWKLHGL